MAATAHLTLVAPANEKFTVRSAPPDCPGANQTWNIDRGSISPSARSKG
jgi:hypothetical protein